MKTNLCFLLVAVFFMCSCQTKPKIVPVNSEAEKAAISALFDSLHTTMVNNDANGAGMFLSEDLLACGTDPSEFLNKKDLVDSWVKAFADTALKMDYTIDKREIKLAADGKSAMVVEQYMMPAISKKIQIRSIQHAVKADQKWIIDFLSWNLIPRNEDLAKLDMALEEETKK